MSNKFLKRAFALFLFGAVLIGNSNFVYAAEAGQESTTPSVQEVDASKAVETLDSTNATKVYVVSDNELTDTYNATNVLKHDNVYVFMFSDMDAARNAYNMLEAKGLSPQFDNNIESKDNEITKSIDSSTSPIDEAVKDNTEEKPGLLQSLFDKKTVVGVIDTGINYEDELFKGKISDKIKDNAKTDENGHGSLVAKIILSESSEDTVILPYKVFDKDGIASTVDVYFAMEEAIDDGVAIINLSSVGDGTCPLIDKAITDAKDKGIPVVCAAGNNSQDVKDYYPADNTDAYVIGASDDGQTISQYSNYGKTVDYLINGTVEDKDKLSYGTSFSAARFSGYLTKITVKDNETLEDVLQAYNSTLKDISQTLPNNSTLSYKYLDDGEINALLATDTTKADAKTPEDREKTDVEQPAKTDTNTESVKDTTDKPAKQDNTSKENNTKKDTEEKNPKSAVDKSLVPSLEDLIRQAEGQTMKISKGLWNSTTPCYQDDKYLDNTKTLEWTIYNMPKDSFIRVDYYCENAAAEKKPGNILATDEFARVHSNTIHNLIPQFMSGRDTYQSVDIAKHIDSNQSLGAITVTARDVDKNGITDFVITYNEVNVHYYTPYVYVYPTSTMGYNYRNSTECAVREDSYAGRGFTYAYNNAWYTLFGQAVVLDQNTGRASLYAGVDLRWDWKVHWNSWAHNVYYLDGYNDKDHNLIKQFVKYYGDKVDPDDPTPTDPNANRNLVPVNPRRTTDTPKGVVDTYSFTKWGLEEDDTMLQQGKKGRCNVSDSPTRAKESDPVYYCYDSDGGTATYTAQWTPVNWTINYNTYGGSYLEPTVYNVENSFYLPHPTKTGFDFRGWHETYNQYGQNTHNDINPNVLISSGSVGNRTFEAYYQSNLKFHAGEGLLNYSGTNISPKVSVSGAESYTNNETKDVSATIYDHQSYNIQAQTHTSLNGQNVDNSFIFAGWNTSPDGSGTWYGDKDIYGNLARASGNTATGKFTWNGDTAGIDLYAQYYVRTNLIYSGNHQTNNVSDYTATINAGLVQNYRGFYFNKNVFERIEYATSFDTYKQADINKRYPYSYHGWSIDSNAYFTDARVYQPYQYTNALDYIYECFRYSNSNRVQDGYITITTYAVWDKYPVFTNKQDVSYPTDTVPNLTVDEINSDILKNIQVADREDTASLYDNKNLQYIKVLDVNLNELLKFKESTKVSATVEVKDSAGNITQTRVNIILNKSTSGDVSEDPDIYNAYVTRYVRSISKDYIDKSHEDGGLLKDSIWRTDPSYKQTLKEAVDENATPEQTFYISNQTRNEIRDFVNKNGIGNAVHGDALIRFNDEFKEKFKVKPQNKAQK